MSVNRQRLGEIVSNVDGARDMHYVEMPLSHAILEPMKSHIARLGELGLDLDGTVGQTDRNLIVTMNDGGALRVHEIGKDLTLPRCNFGSSKSEKCRRIQPLGRKSIRRE